MNNTRKNDSHIKKYAERDKNKKTVPVRPVYPIHKGQVGLITPVANFSVNRSHQICLATGKKQTVQHRHETTKGGMRGASKALDFTYVVIINWMDLTRRSSIVLEQATAFIRGSPPRLNLLHQRPN